MRENLHSIGIVQSEMEMISGSVYLFQSTAMQTRHERNMKSSMGKLTRISTSASNKYKTLNIQKHQNASKRQIDTRLNEW